MLFWVMALMGQCWLAMSLVVSIVWATRLLCKMSWKTNAKIKIKSKKKNKDTINLYRN